MTLYKFLKGNLGEENLGEILQNCDLRDIEVEAFFKKFGEMTKDELIEFLKDEKNAYDIFKFAYRYNRQDRIPPRKRETHNYNVQEEAY